ncbi:MAG: M14 family zinc carboxypeptidase [Fidelibacterota bacterium]
MINKHHLIISLLILRLTLCPLNGQIPSNYQNIKKPINYQTLTNYLTAIEKPGFIELTEAGKSVEGRSLHLVHLFHNNQLKKLKLFFYAQQHGNEPAGKDALIYLIKKIKEDPAYLPDYVDLWIMPMVNPDGAEHNQRRNANDMDLNRDHRLLSQPEIQTLHETARKIMPHVAIDCHEFTRDNKDYADHGWQKWPLIMMDCANNPLYSQCLYETGVEWIDRIKPVMHEKNINYTRYYVGGLPPDDELRFSTLEPDDGRNGIGAYSVLSFIIESGIFRNAANPDANLTERIEAYLTIFDQFIHASERYEHDIQIVENARKATLQDFIPTNYFWGSQPGSVHDVNVIDKETDQTIRVKTANFMHRRIVKNSVRRPEKYLIPREYIDVFTPLLDRHAIEYKTLKKGRQIELEAVKYIRFETEFDDVYNRYENRVISEVQKPESITVEKGSLLIPVEQKFPWKVVLLLEPSMMYSLFSDTFFRESIDKKNRFPIYRVFK